MCRKRKPNNGNNQNKEYDGQLVRYLQNWHLDVLNYYRERLRNDGFLTICQTGDWIFHCEPFSTTIPTNIKIGKYRGLIFYKGQINQNTEIECTKYLQNGHKKQTVTMTRNARHAVQKGTSLRITQLMLIKTIKLSQKCRPKSQMKQMKMNLKKVRRLFYHNRPKTCQKHHILKKPVQRLSFPKIQTTYRYQTKTHLKRTQTDQHINFIKTT